MIPQVLRIHSNWLKDNTYGVNAQLAALESESLLDGDTVPPDVAFIGNQIDDRVVARWVDPPERPAIYVNLDLPISFQQADQRPGQLRGVVPVGIRYFTAHGNPDEAAEDTAHTLRAIYRSLIDLYLNANSASRTRAGIYVEAYSELLLGDLAETVGNSLVTGGIVLRARVIETSP